ncbi:MAG: hypothetical protein ACYST2_02435 [Planctomycetota bacterium]|jgi:hypothetical protein
MKIQLEKGPVNLENNDFSGLLFKVKNGFNPRKRTAKSKKILL